jgi:hypothetical protein
MQQSDYTRRLYVLAAQYGANSYDPYYSGQEQYKELSKEEIAFLIKKEIIELLKQKQEDKPCE